MLEQFKGILETMLAELEHPLRRRDQIAIENTPDALDEVQNAAERDLAIRQLEHDSSRFRYLKAALQRIEEGTFGQCARCESDISIKRLKAVPWAQYCLDCQDIADHSTAEMEAEVVQFTDQGPKIMRAGQGAARGQSQPQLVQESRSADSDSEFAGNDLETSTPVYPASPEKKPSAFERPRRRARQSA
jgi:RNA polymerase-binding transcription factor